MQTLTEIFLDMVYKLALAKSEYQALQPAAPFRSNRSIRAERMDYASRAQHQMYEITDLQKRYKEQIVDLVSGMLRCQDDKEELIAKCAKNVLLILALVRQND